jgi:hypothetical protein
MLYYVMCLILTPLVYLGIKGIHLLVLAFAAYGFFIQGTFAWTPIWLPELFPTRMRGTAAGFIFNAPRLISAIAPLIAGTIIVGLGGYGRAATTVGMFYILDLTNLTPNWALKCRRNPRDFDDSEKCKNAASLALHRGGPDPA